MVQDTTLTLVFLRDPRTEDAEDSASPGEDLNASTFSRASIGAVPSVVSPDVLARLSETTSFASAALMEGDEGSSADPSPTVPTATDPVDASDEEGAALEHESTYLATLVRDTLNNTFGFDIGVLDDGRKVRFLPDFMLVCGCGSVGDCHSHV